ncbi:MAG: c-type cytochrome [Acidobacteria bacterium]|nr:c-type cytochrome [Acidobacteriota bacterium]
MPRSWIPAAAVLCVAAAVTLSARQTVPPPVRTPAGEIATFALPVGYRVELVAAEPLVQDPVAIDWDADGRLWVVEMPGYMTDIRASDEHAPTGRVVVLEDADADGRMDRRTVFADGLVLPRAIKVLERGVLVGEPPYLWLMRDENGDFRADSRLLVTDRYGRRDAVVEHNLNSLTWTLDNWIHTSEGDIVLRLKQGAFDVRPTLPRGQWGVTQDDAGRLYRNTNESALHVDVVPTPYYARNPDLVRTRGSYESLGGADDAIDIVWPARPTPGVNRGYQAGILRDDGRLARFTAVAAPTVYRGDRLPAELYGNVFVVEPSANLVSRIVVEDDGRGLSARKAYDGAEFIASTDERFRPVHLSSAPDGTLYVIDMYRGIIQHKAYITEYLRDYIVSHQVEQPVSLGRIFRVVHDSTRPGPRPALGRATGAQLVAALSHLNGWWRDTAQRLMVERGDRRVAPALRALATSAAPARTRLHALWTLEGLDALTPADVVRALSDGSRDVRTSAVRLAEAFVGDATVQAALLARLDERDWNVRAQLAATLGELPAGLRERALAALLDRAAGDPIVVDAALSGMRGAETAVLDRLLEGTVETPERRAAIAMIAATVIRSKQEPRVQEVWTKTVSAARAEWQRAALLEGTEIALTGALPPGSVRRAAAAPATAAPCPTCPGGRGGPGGARAFPEVLGEGGAAASARAGGPAMTLGAPPVLVTLASADSALGRRAARVLERVAWPGKPGVSGAAVAPLTADETRRFAEGQRVYEAVCQGCHQANGRGLDRVAPSLVDSALVAGDVPVLARVLLHGKEGSVGLMPPLGATLGDDQIASVLTYIRRAWGLTASAVDPAAIERVRAATAGRARPWTDAELR